MNDPTYDATRAKRLGELLRALATRIQEFRNDETLLAAGPELMKMMGDARSELFHYEVRSTYTSPEVANSRRIVEDAKQTMQSLDFGDGFDGPGDEEGDQPWRSR